MRALTTWALAAALLAGCSFDLGAIAVLPTDVDAGSTDGGPDASVRVDAGPEDLGSVDLGSVDLGETDLGETDLGALDDAGTPEDAGALEDAGPSDSGASDLGAVDLGPSDLGPPDLGAVDLGAVDLGAVDLGASDLGPSDLGPSDLGPSDLGAFDLGASDLGPSDLGPSDLGAPDMGGPDMGAADLGTRCAPRPPGGDPNWARFPLPGTPGHDRSYQVVGAVGDETVIDCVTGLEWQQSINAGRNTYAAIAFCDGLTLGGYSDWRLPSAIELMTLVDYSISAAGPTIDLATFPGTGEELFWTSTAVPASLVEAHWGVFFADGNVYNEAPTWARRTRCVR